VGSAGKEDIEKDIPLITSVVLVVEATTSQSIVIS
jgi:hypothetical protein